MSNTSASAGYLTPSATSPPQDDNAFDAVLQQFVVGVTGLPGQYVRPRWQPVPPKQPEPDVNWCAIGETGSTRETYPYIEHNPADGLGSDTLSRTEEITVLASFYGPGSRGLVKAFADGCQIPQNIDQLKASGVALIETGAIAALPELVNQQWIRRYDISLRVRRRVSRTYAVQTITSAQMVLETLDNSVRTIPVTVHQ